MFSVQLKQLFLDLVFIFLEDPLLSSIFPATLLAAALSAFDGIFGDVQLVFLSPQVGLFSTTPQSHQLQQLAPIFSKGARGSRSW